MNKLEFTFLEKGVFEGCYELGIRKLDIYEKHGTRAAITDFAILLGGKSYSIPECKGQWGRWWTGSSAWARTRTRSMYYYINGSPFTGEYKLRCIGARPLLPYSLISQICVDRDNYIKGIHEVEYGEYPQTVVSEDFASTLENAYLDGTIKQTDKKYTTDSVHIEDYDTLFRARKHIEYEYNGKKYIRFEADSNCRGKVLSDGRIVQEGSPYWVEVEPIKWLKSSYFENYHRYDIVLSEKIIFAGVQFDDKDFCGDFEKTTIARFMNDIFANDIIPSDEKQQIEAKSEELKRVQQKLKEVEEERARLIAEELKIQAQIDQIKLEAKGKGQYVK